MDAGMSLGRLSRSAGLESNALAGIEQGSVRPTLATLDRIAKGLNITIMELVRGAREEIAPLAAGDLRTRLDRIASAIAELPDEIGSKLDAVEAAVVRHAMAICGNNRSAAARLLGVERKALVRRWERIRRETKEAAKAAR
jgi:transcriptional regulator with XRE-family HTH domain